MKTIDKIIALIGVAVGIFGTAYAYYANAHDGVSSTLQWLYIVLIPASLGLMATDHASTTERIVIEIIVVIFNGALYGLVSMMIRRKR